jgi:hypothetical protein
LFVIEVEALPALADDIEGALDEVFVSEVNGMAIAFAPVLNILAAPAPTSHMPPPSASNALLWAGVIVFGCGT